MLRFVALAAIAVLPATQAAVAEAAAPGSPTARYIQLGQHRYFLLDPKRARDMSIWGMGGALLGEVGAGFGIRRRTDGQRFAIECILWPAPEPFSSLTKKSCQSPSKISLNAPADTVAFQPQMWTKMRSALRAKYPRSEHPLGNGRSVMIFGVGRTSSWLTGRKAYLEVEDWIIVGRENDYHEVFADGLAAMKMGGRIGSGMGRTATLLGR